MELRTRIVDAVPAIVVAACSLGLTPGATAVIAAPVCGFNRAVGGGRDTRDRNPAQRNGVHGHPEETLVLGGQRRAAAYRKHHRKGTACGRDQLTAAIKSLAANGGCTILTLDLGPLNLDLLRNAVDLSSVNLVATVVPGVSWRVRHVR